MLIDRSNWSGEGTFTAVLLEKIAQIAAVDFLRVEAAPASRSEADYNFISNEIFVTFRTDSHVERGRRFGVFPTTTAVAVKSMTMSGLDAALASMSDVGSPDYSDEGMLQYLRAERIIPPYQTRGYKLVELVRIYESGQPRVAS
jgi:hypothetical protein